MIVNNQWSANVMVKLIAINAVECGGYSVFVNVEIYDSFFANSSVDYFINHYYYDGSIKVINTVLLPLTLVLD